MQRRSEPIVMAMTSGKGGVGKTNVVVNVAVCLAKVGKKVMIFDADLGLGNIDVLFGLTPRYNLYHLLKGERKLSDVLITGPQGIKILPASSGIQELTQLTEEQQLILLSELDNYSEEIDVLLIDTAAGISSNVVYFNLAAQHILVVVSPEPTSITDAYALMKVLSTRYSERSFKLVVNNVFNESEGKEVYRKLTTAADRFLNISIDYMGFIPYDRNLTLAVKKQKAVVELFPYSPSSRAFTQLAEEINNTVSDGYSKGNIQLFWKKLVASQERVL